MWTVITGGQTGADTGALVAARELGIPWRAIFPAGFLREKPAPKWMMEHAQECVGSSRYDDRTRTVVRMADMVLIVGGELETPGTKLTMELARHYGKPLVDANTWNMSGTGNLMVAGPRASKWADSSLCAYQIVKAMFWQPESPGPTWKREYQGIWIEPD